jgi:hypothetical protein
MYEFSQILSGVKSGHTKRLYYIKTEHLSTHDLKFIYEIQEFWYEVEVNVMSRLKPRMLLTEIEVLAKNNNFYRKDIREIPLFLDDRKCINYTDDAIKGMVGDLKNYFESPTEIEDYKRKTDEYSKKIDDYEITVNVDRPIYISYSHKDSSDIEKK